MIAALLLAGVLVVGVDAPATYSTGWEGLLRPNLHLTPGVTRDLSPHAVCHTKWSRDVRHVTARMKGEVCGRYGARHCPGPQWEVDHLIPRELGGADAIENLWPQPITEARLKDRVENFLHRAVCYGAMTLGEAQEALRDDWTRAYFKMKEGP